MISETLKNLSREKLEELCQLALQREHNATHRANELEDRIDKAIELINKALNIDSEYVEYEFGTELLKQELSKILKGEENENSK